MNHRGRSNPPRSARTGAAGAYWRALALATLALALTPLVAGPGTARAASSPVTYLLRAENSDGGFGAGPGQTSAGLYTGWAALGLASAGQDLQRLARGGHGLLTYLGTSPGETSDVGSLERTILVVRAAGQSAARFAGHDLVSQLQRHIRGNGSVSGEVNLTAFAVLALRAASVVVPADTYAWLERQQDRDGGFNFAGAGDSSDIDDTGAVLEALAGRAASVRAGAVTYLRRHQNRDGGFPQEPGGTSNAQSTAWAVQGFDAVGVAPGSVHHDGSPSPVAYLHSLIAPDGHVRYARASNQTPVWVTGEALMALEGKPLPLAPEVGARGAHAKPKPKPAASGNAGSSAPAAGAPVVSTTSPAPAPTAAAPPSRPAAKAAATRGTARAGTRPTLPVPGPVSAAQLAGAAGFATALVLAPLDIG
jgi:prenyltransferase beta subunit